MQSHKSPQTKKKNNITFQDFQGVKPQPEPVALAFHNTMAGQSHHGAVILAWLCLAYLGLAWPGSRL